MNLRSILPGPTDRAVLLGQTGSGKTRLAQEMLLSRTYVVCIDTKGLLGVTQDETGRIVQEAWPGYMLVKRAKDLARQRAARIVYRPYGAEQDPDSIDRVCAWVYRRRNTTLYVDETAQVAPGGIAGQGLLDCITRGREHGVEVWCASQRPVSIPLVCLTETEHWYVFRLGLREDRQRVYAMCGLPENEVGRLPKWQFYHVAQSEAEVAEGPMKLHLEEG